MEIKFTAKVLYGEPSDKQVSDEDLEELRLMLQNEIQKYILDNDIKFEIIDFHLQP
jgi:hypothetical protein